MKPDTLAVHPPAAPAPDATNAPVAPPIHPAASFEGDPEHLAALLQGDGEGFVYARYMNPTCVGVERALAALEGGEGAVWCASGMAALTAVLSTRLQAGDEVLCAARIYGVTAALLTRIVARQGVQVRFGDADTLTAGPRTRVILAETIANPGLETADLPGLAARKGDAWLVIDNTFASPALCRPLEHGADVVVHSASKYIGGHGDLIAGAVVADAVKAAAIRSVASTMGLTGDPWTAFLAARGLKTLPLRMARHSSNARAVAACLRGLGLPVRAAAPRPWLSDTGGMLCVDLPDRQTAFAFLRALRLFRCATSLGDCHSMALHPASTSHRDFDAAALTAAGITQGTLRLSVGLEDPSDLCADLEQAVAALPS
jgi:methionine-gamma-lyase